MLGGVDSMGEELLSLGMAVMLVYAQ